MREVSRLSRLVEEYLQFGRLPEGRRESVPLDELVAEVADLVSLEFRRTGVTIETRVAPALPPVSGDAGQLRQALLNVLQNARDAMPEGGRVTVEARETVGSP